MELFGEDVYEAWLKLFSLVSSLMSHSTALRLRGLKSQRERDGGGSRTPMLPLH